MPLFIIKRACFSFLSFYHFAAAIRFIFFTIFYVFHYLSLHYLLRAFFTIYSLLSHYWSFSPTIIIVAPPYLVIFRAWQESLTMPCLLVIVTPSFQKQMSFSTYCLSPYYIHHIHYYLLIIAIIDIRASGLSSFSPSRREHRYIFRAFRCSPAIYLFFHFPPSLMLTSFIFILLLLFSEHIKRSFCLFLRRAIIIKYFSLYILLFIFPLSFMPLY